REHVHSLPCPTRRSSDLAARLLGPGGAGASRWSCRPGAAGPAPGLAAGSGPETTAGAGHGLRRAAHAPRLVTAPRHTVAGRGRGRSPQRVFDHRLRSALRRVLLGLCRRTGCGCCRLPRWIAERLVLRYPQPPEPGEAGKVAPELVQGGDRVQAVDLVAGP